MAPGSSHHRVYSGRITEKKSLDAHRISKLCADFGAPHAVETRWSPLKDRVCGQLARNHRIVNSLSAEAIDKSAGVANQHDPILNGPLERAADRD
jgi:hypothetical protein